MRRTFRKILFFIMRVESRLVLWKYRPRVIAITGSVGKTSTKDAVYAVISKLSYVRKSEKSYNSEIGLPLTVLGCPNGWNDLRVWLRNIMKGLRLILTPNKYPKWLVLEVGIGKPGDMKKTASWIKSDVVIMTAIGETPVHIEFFEDRNHLIKEKSGLIQTLKPDGVLILNADDSNIMALKEKTKNRVLTFGWKEGADIRASSENISYAPDGTPQGLSFKLEEGGNTLPVVIDGVFGRNHMYASLSALALAQALKLNILEAINALRDYDVPPGRMRLLTGINSTMILDDSYNSSPSAVEMALRTMGEIKVKGRRIAVLGDMLELGRHTEEAHKRVGKLARESSDLLFTVGLRAKSIKEGAKEAGMNEKNIFEFLSSREAGEKLRDFIKAGDFILIKGSQGMRMERAVEMIMAEPENKERLLVRQDPEWLKKE